MLCQHPGKVLLKQYLEPHRISQNKLARAIKVPPRRINEIVHEKRAISADTAVRLGIFFGNSASYWMHLQAEFDIEKIRGNISIQLNTIQAPVQRATTETQPAPRNSTKKSDEKQLRTNIKNRVLR